MKRRASMLNTMATNSVATSTYHRNIDTEVNFLSKNDFFLLLV
jgi:hypothetical protein